MSSRKNRSPKEQDRRAIIRELPQESSISSVKEFPDLFKEFIAEFAENNAKAELDDELGCSSPWRPSPRLYFRALSHQPSWTINSLSISSARLGQLRLR